MTNHVHLLLTAAANGSPARLMQSLGRRYVNYINRFYRRTGSIREDQAGHGVLPRNQKRFMVARKTIVFCPLLFNAPAWVHERCGAQRLPVTDVARLYLLTEVLMQGYERVIWLDADTIVFDPDSLEIPVGEGYAFCREIVLRRDGRGACESCHTVLTTP